MSSELNWKYPDWIYAAEHKIKNIDVTKFLFPIYINYEIVSPKYNKHTPRWAIVVKIRIDARDRVSGIKSQVVSSAEGIYVYRSSDVEDVIFEELSRLVDHELRECFQIRESGVSKTQIPFDPHVWGRDCSLYAIRKINSFPHHPSLTSWLWHASIKIITKLFKTFVSFVRVTPPLALKNEFATLNPEIKVTLK